MTVRLDVVDRKILSELQKDASRSLDDIAKTIGASKTPVWNRIKKLREAGVIKRTTVELDAEALGFEACFFVLIRTSEHEADWQDRFLTNDLPNRRGHKHQARSGVENTPNPRQSCRYVLEKSD